MEGQPPFRHGPPPTPALTAVTDWALEHEAARRQERAAALTSCYGEDEKAGRLCRAQCGPAFVSLTKPCSSRPAGVHQRDLRGQEFAPVPLCFGVAAVQGPASHFICTAAFMSRSQADKRLCMPALQRDRVACARFALVCSLPATPGWQLGL